MTVLPFFRFSSLNRDSTYAFRKNFDRRNLGVSVPVLDSTSQNPAIESAPAPFPAPRPASAPALGPGLAPAPGPAPRPAPAPAPASRPAPAPAPVPALGLAPVPAPAPAPAPRPAPVPATSPVKLRLSVSRTGAIWATCRSGPPRHNNRCIAPTTINEMV